MGSLVQQSSLIGAAVTTRTETFSACTAGNVMVLAASLNENAGTDTFNTLTGWTKVVEARPLSSVTRTALWVKLSVGGETSVTITSSVAQRFQTWFGEFSGYSLTVDDTSTVGTSSASGTLDTSTCTATVAGGLYLGVIGAKNSCTLSTPAGYTRATVTNELGTASTQKVTLGVYYDLADSGNERVQPTCSPTAAYSGLGVMLKPASGTAYTQSVSGAVSFAGIRPRVAGSRRLPGSVSFSGARTSSPTGRFVSGAFQPSGVVSRQLALARLVQGVFQPVGATSRTPSRTVTGALSFVGSQSRIKSVSKAVSGALSFTGSQTRIAAKALTAVLTPVGSLARALALHVTLTASLGLVSPSFLKTTNRRFVAALASVGMVGASQPTTHFSGSLHPTGTVSHGLPARTMYAAMTFASTMPRFVARQLVASLVAAGVLHTHYLPPVAPPFPGGGGYGALMSDSHFQRYNVAKAWRHMKRVKL